MHQVSSSSIYLLLTSTGKGGAFTVRSNRTGKDYTFKIRRLEYKGQIYTHVFVEQEYLKFKHLGCFYNGLISKGGSVVNTPAAIAAQWLLRQVIGGRFEYVDSEVAIFHLGKCLKCGKTLTDASSIEAGLGPICRN